MRVPPRLRTAGQLPMTVTAPALAAHTNRKWGRTSWAVRLGALEALLTRLAERPGLRQVHELDEFRAQNAQVRLGQPARLHALEGSQLHAVLSALAPPAGVLNAVEEVAPQRCGAVGGHVAEQEVMPAKVEAIEDVCEVARVQADAAR